jgi:hypothetical protein
MHRLRALLNIKHETKRACRPLAKQLLAVIDELKASCFSSLLTLAETLSRWRERWRPCGALPKTTPLPKASIAKRNSSNAGLRL